MFHLAELTTLWCGCQKCGEVVPTVLASGPYGNSCLHRCPACGGTFFYKVQEKRGGFRGRRVVECSGEI